MFCQFCGTQTGSGAKFCPGCGKALAAQGGETILGDVAYESDAGETLVGGAVSPAPTPAPQQVRKAIQPPPTASSPMLSTDAVGGGRFAPGTIIAERYRVVALLGRGGMGEVYRAEDLKLTQLVAIKFLPEALSKDAAALGRFHNEVRIARQVSHPNVCRVFDIGDAGGIPFLTMEFVDGEDLASLVRRIGRLPEDKAIEVSRQICAGLAAAHERGVIHRDLKPANLMLDGAGKVRITDFGLAGIAATIQGAEVRAGTPAYMAPEQLAGKEVSAKSDIFSLGLVMYEVLTGRRAYQGNTLPELMKSREEGALTNPSSLVRDLDPLIERVILRCLERDPSKRPTSALQVAAALPGGDPLAAALAAGETPSPEMVAAAGEREGFAPKLAALCLLGVILGLGVFLLTAKRAKLVSYLPFGPSPEVLVSQAHGLMEKLGYTTPAADSAWGFVLDNAYIAEITRTSKSPQRWDVLKQSEPAAMNFWYRESPRQILSFAPSDNLLYGRISPDEPPFLASGARKLVLDLRGHLLLFEAVTPQVAPVEAGKAVEPDWSVLFAASGLDPAKFTRVEPTWYPLSWGDTRAAWTGTWPTREEIPLRIEAAGYQGKPIYFDLISPWDKPTRQAAPVQSQNSLAQLFGLSLLAILLGAGIWLTVRNLRSGRGDLRGAVRLGLVVLVLRLVIWLLVAHHVMNAAELVQFIMALSSGLFFAGFTWLLYMAIEPYIRKYWPDTMISWTRMLNGEFKDPLVARHVLLGTLFGVISAVLEHLQPIVEETLRKPPMRPMGFPFTYDLEGFRGALAGVLYQASQSFSSALVIFLLFFLIRLVLKRNILAAVVTSLLVAVPSLAAQNPVIDILFSSPFIFLYLVILARFGLVSLVALYFADQLLDSLPLAMPLNAWYTEGGLVAAIFIVGLAIYGYHYSRAGKPLFEPAALEI